MNGPLFLDVETTGLIPKTWNWQTDYKRFPRIVSISWKFRGEMTSTIINQRGVEIPERAIAVHGITNDRANQSEYTIDSVLLWLIEDALQADWIVGHNLYFDTSICKANALREFGPNSSRADQIITALDKKKRIDVMRRSAKICGGWNTMELLHEKLFGCKMQDVGLFPHNSYDDVLCVERIYEELLKRNAIYFPIQETTTPPL